MGIFGQKKVTTRTVNGSSGNCTECGQFFSGSHKEIYEAGLLVADVQPSAASGCKFCSVGCARNFAQSKGWIFK